MKSTLSAVEISGRIDENSELHLDELLPLSGPQKVRVIVLYSASDDISESEWLQAGAQNSAFDFLNAPEEDIYSLSDGEPFRAEV